MKTENFKENFKAFCRRVGKRNFIIFGAVVLILAAVVINVAVFANDDDGFDYDQSAGMDAGKNEGTSSMAENTQSVSDSYFSSVQLNRQRNLIPH